MLVNRQSMTARTQGLSNQNKQRSELQVVDQTRDEMPQNTIKLDTFLPLPFFFFFKETLMLGTFV